jgi:hypothetical protein
MKQLFGVVGKTLEGQLVVSGVLRFEETFGLPLADILVVIKNNNMIPSWIHLRKESEAQNSNPERFSDKLRIAVTDVYGIDYWEFVKKGLCL